MDKIIESLSPIELKVVPFLDKDFEEMVSQSGLDKTSVLRALNFLESKGLVKIKQEKKSIIVLDTNGIYYKKNGLPERNLLSIFESANYFTLQEAKEKSKLSDNEFKAALGVLKRKELINIRDGKVSLAGSRESVAHKMDEEKFIDELPIDLDKLTSEQKRIFESLKSRKEIVMVQEENITSFEVTEEGKKIAGKKIDSGLLEEVTPALIMNMPKNKKFRRYDINAKAPQIYGGKRHFVRQSVRQGKRIWLDMGFSEMAGDYVVSSFWNFDALFTAQDHPVRDMHDTFFIKDSEKELPDKKLVNEVKKAHESGVGGSKGWRYKWSEESARKPLLRTHTTCLSAQTLYSLKKENFPAKFFSIGKCFRNETVDWTHGFEFNQSEGIVIDKNANFRHLVGYLKEFARKMGYDKFRIQPSYFPYTEPSLEGSIWHEEKQQWVEVIAAGIFRPEVTIPLLGTATPVLAWGPGFDRLMMAAHKIKDLRELYKNDIKILRNKKVLVK